MQCNICPRRCGADRENGSLGFCGASNKIRIARAALHFWEEPCLSGANGAGTVFFSYCNMKCVYCQNYRISTRGAGHEVSIGELAEIFLDLQSQGANNIDLVTPTHYALDIAEAVKKAKNSGLHIPVLYNCGGYESVETLKRLEGIIDIYMPDMKYYRDKYAVKYSSAPRYFETACAALEEMYRQTGAFVLDENGIMQSGVIVRHMMLPGLMLDTKKIMDYLFDTYGNNIYISLMSQYTPLKNVERFPELNRKIDMKKYNSIVDYCMNRGMENVFIQEGSAAKESFIPCFEE
ncbi:MAG: radical SAM protein [Monoglobales bacterium]